jgi:hypothetical protein
MLSSNGDKLKMAIDQVPVAHNDGKQAIAIGGNSGQISQRADVTVVHDGEKRTTRKSSFRICKPQGTFLWPSMGSGTDISGGGSSGISIATSGSLPRSGSGSCPGIGPGLPPSSRAPVEVLIESPLDEHVMVGDYFSTPPSALSTNALSSHIHSSASCTLKQTHGVLCKNVKSWAHPFFYLGNTTCQPHNVLYDFAPEMQVCVPL